MIPEVYPNNINLIRSEHLKASLILSEIICKYVNSIILFSSNDPDRAQVMLEKVQRLERHRFDAIPDELDEARDDVNALMHSMKTVVDLAREELAQIKKNNPQFSDNFSLMFIKAGIAQKYGVGNCLEMSSIGFANACANKVNQRVEIFIVKGGDHAFLVIGRAEGSDPDNPLTWGESATVCDPWAKAIYPAYEIPEKLLTYAGPNFHRGSRRETPKIEKFDPEVHQLRQLVDYHPGQLPPPFLCEEFAIDSSM